MVNGGFNGDWVLGRLEQKEVEGVSTESKQRVKEKWFILDQELKITGLRPPHGGGPSPQIKITRHGWQ